MVLVVMVGQGVISRWRVMKGSVGEAGMGLGRWVGK